MPPGQYTLTLSGAGAEGIAGISGVPLAGNVPGSNTFATTFSVVGEPSAGNNWSSLPGFNDPQHAQPIGVLFPVQLNQGVTIAQDASQGSVTQADYSIELLQSRQYSVSIDGDVAAGCTITVFDANGVVEATFTYKPGENLPAFFLSAGTYTLQLTSPAGLTDYVLHLSYSGSPDNPTPLVVGSGPALRIRLLTGTPDGAAPPTVPATGGTAPAVTVAASSSGLLPGVFTLPSSALLALGFSPLEGVAAAGGADYSGGSRPAVLAPGDSSGGGPSLNLVIVTQAPLASSGDEDQPDAPTAPATSGTGGQGAPAPEGITRLLDLMFEYWGWFTAPAPAPGAAAPAPPATEGGAEESGMGLLLPTPATHPAPAAEPEASWGWACALAAGAMAVATGSRRRSPARVGRPGELVPKTP